MQSLTYIGLSVQTGCDLYTDRRTDTRVKLLLVLETDANKDENKHTIQHLNTLNRVGRFGEEKPTRKCEREESNTKQKCKYTLRFPYPYSL